jgi:hypothetical protein
MACRASCGPKDSPGTEAPGLSLTSTPGATPEEEHIVSDKPNTSALHCPFAKNESGQSRPLRPLPR